MTQNTAVKYLEEKYQVNYILATGLGVANNFFVLKL